MKLMSTNPQLYSTLYLYTEFLVTNGAIESINKTLIHDFINSIAEEKENSEQIVMPNFDVFTPFVDTKIDGTNLQLFNESIYIANKNATLSNDTQLFETTKRPTKGLAVDVGCKGNPGKTEFRGVDISTGKTVFHIQIPGVSTNNIGEFLAAVTGLQYLKHAELEHKVYSDSMTAIAWVRQKQCKTKQKIDNTDQQKMIDNAQNYLKTFGGTINFWNNKLWGEIPADLSGIKGVKR